MYTSKSMVRMAAAAVMASMLVLLLGAALAQQVFAESAGLVGNLKTSEITHGEDILIKDISVGIVLKGGPETYHIVHKVIPEDAQDKEIIWSSSDENVAVVDSTGTITAKAEGEAEITAKLKHTGKERTLSVLVTTEDLPDPETAWPTKELYNLVLGEQAQIQVGTHPLPSKIDKIEYKADKENIVNVDDNGVITAVGTGSTQVHITVTTYTESDPSGMVMIETFVNINVFENKDTPILNITQQPEDVDVTYPDGADFQIKVDHPENVRSYRWELRVYSIEDRDSFNIYALDGESAKTNHLIVPSTEYESHPHYFRCIVTDLHGKKHVSDEALMTVVNRKEVKPVFYVGEYAVEPGESLDLEDYGIGSGTVAYDKNTFDVTMTDVDLNNRYSIYDSTQAASTGVFFSAIDDSKPIEERLEYTLHFKGDCRINNTYYDPENNAGGVTVNAYFGTKDLAEMPTLRVEGDGLLTLIGGGDSIYVHDGNLDIATDIRTLPMGINYNRGLYAHSIAVEKGVDLDIKSCGPAITAVSGDIWVLDRANIFIDTIAPHISKGLAAFSVINSAGSISCSRANINIKCTAVPENIIPYYSTVSMIAGISAQGRITLDDTLVIMSMSKKKWSDKFVHNYYGISGGDLSSLSLTGGSSLDLEIGGSEVYGAYGISVGGNIVVDPDCMIRVYAISANKAAGITTDGRLSVKDGIVDVHVLSMSPDKEVTALTTGILCGEADLDVPVEENYVYSVVGDGAAYIAGGQEKTTDPIVYTKDYKPQYTAVSKGSELTRPVKGAISGYGYNIGGMTYKAETVYDLKDTSKPSLEACFGDMKAKKANPIEVKGRKVTVKYRKLKKKAQSIKRSKALKISDAEGKLTYKKVSVSKKKYSGKFKVNTRTGRITVKKGVKKGRYKLRVKVSAAGNNKYKAKAVIRTVTIKVK